MTKKIFIISAVLLVLLIGAIFVYNFAFKKPADPSASIKTTNEGKTNTNTGNADANNQTNAKQTGDAITAISDVRAFGATLAPDQKTIYYFAGDNGQVNQVNSDGKLQKVVSIEQFQNIESIAWNRPKNKAIVKRSDGPQKSKYLLLDQQQKSVSVVKDNATRIAWTALGDKIIYAYYNAITRKSDLEVSDPNGANWRKITDISNFSILISPIPGTSDISYWPYPDAYTASPANSIGLSGENKKDIITGRFGIDLLWSPDGKYAAVSYTDQKGGKKTDLAIMNSDGGQFHTLNFPTFVKKCAWSAGSKYLYCAMPGNIPESAILPNDWQEGKVQTADTFWRIEIATGKRDRLVETDKINGSFDALDPFLSQDEKTLFFTNKVDGKLYKLGL